MLTRILAALDAAGRPLCAADLRRELDIEGSALEGMLDTLVARGRLRALRFDGASCGGCPVRSGCFIMDDGVVVTYALVGTKPERVVESDPIKDRGGATQGSWASGVAGPAGAS